MVRRKKARVWFFLNDTKNSYLNICCYNDYIDSRTKNNKTTTKICLQCWFKLAISSFQSWLLTPRSLDQTSIPALWNICLRLQKLRWLPHRFRAALFSDLHDAIQWLLCDKGKKCNWDSTLQLQLFAWMDSLWDNILLKLYSIHFLKTRILILP